MAFLRRWIIFCILAIVLLFTILNTLGLDDRPHRPHRDGVPPPFTLPYNFRWKNARKRFPVEQIIPLPTGPAAAIPRIQYAFEQSPETVAQRARREMRLRAVKRSFEHSWEGYKKHAWLQDEVTPLTGTYKNGYGAWGATLVDSLDTLWIMGLKKDFAVAVASLKKVDFTSSPLDTINVFETTIRYLGGLLSAYDVSEGQYPQLLEKAIELGDMLYVAFDTPNHMPITRWDWRNAAMDGRQEALGSVLLAEVGSLSLEFTRLTQLSGDLKYYDAIQRITDVFEKQQNDTKLPGLWPVRVNTLSQDFTKDRTFTFGGMADSLYEYFPKQHLMLAGRTQQYRRMYEIALETAKEHLFFRPLNPKNQEMLISGSVKRNSADNLRLQPEGQHLTCFVGGMVGLAARVFDEPQELATARQLVDGCIWAYESMPSGIMPEIFTALPCKNTEFENCTWSDERWFQAVADNYKMHEYRHMSVEEHAQTVIQKNNLPPGIIKINDSRFLLRPEAIESLFILYRITGDRTLQEKAWNMFQAIETQARTKIAYASIDDVSVQKSSLSDSMESFWTAETLKYFYLIFSEPDVVSLDEFVL